ncbi:6-hydroxymethylpterin diphosphokinase MptE-like protein [Halopenitus sp. H-Gu1]|uniref:6-hydroxymethylpterin diphosphokinase MptE-like protein n=1 Tax=Halopenitus sp. H-Gu1 TaxID=3242697 RepID=UPI00359CDB73
MNFETWEPVYEAVLADFGFDRADDEHARDVANAFATPFDPGRFDGFEGSTVAIAGAGPSIENASAVERAHGADAVLAASTAADVLLDAGVELDAMITDLDKNPETGRRLSESGVPVVAHAHGDNVPAVREWLPRFADEHVLATTQARPRGNVYGFGGFTDGDRAAFLADHFDAAELVFVGWDFDDPTVDPMKMRKLRWAERLLAWLEVRRDERFAVLEGRRPSVPMEWPTD